MKYNKISPSMGVACPRCRVAPGVQCIPRKGEKKIWEYGIHLSRMNAWWDALTDEEKEEQHRQAADAATLRRWPGR